MAYIDTKYLGKCETCRHFRSGGCNTYCDHGEEYSPDLSKMPAADVAPKSEVAREIEALENEVGKIYNHYVFEDTDYADDDVAVEAAMNALTEVLNLIAEFKDKYTEEKEL